MDTQTCPVCGEIAKVDSAQGYFAVFINCRHCGKFFIEDDCFEENKLEPKSRVCLYYYLTHQYLPNKNLYPRFHKNKEWISLEDSKTHLIYLPTLHTIYPEKFSERVDKVLLNVSDHCRKFSDTIIYSNDISLKIKNICFVIENDAEQASKEAKEILEILSKLNYLDEPSIIRTTLSLYTMEYKITPDGRLRIQELQQNNKVLAQGFIAMWFDKSMGKARLMISEAIKNSGYLPSIIDIKEHNNQIVPEIFYEIKSSQFVVADLTGQRGGVYYEAGYAEALNKPVILCCKKSDFDNMHFDVRQKNCIVWENEEDLYNRLKKRIEATIGKA